MSVFKTNIYVHTKIRKKEETVDFTWHGLEHFIKIFMWILQLYKRTNASVVSMSGKIFREIYSSENFADTSKYFSIFPDQQSLK